ncbi:MAG: hypothetical protein ACI3XQ_08445 [Eubacteriales bacterium]
MKKLICIMLVLIMLSFSLASCQKGKSNETESSNSTVSTESETNKAYADDLPEDLDFDGQQITIACRGGDWWEMELNQFEMSDNIVNNSVYMRNTAVQNRLNVVLNVVPGNTSQSTYMGDVKTAVLSGMCDYDIVAGAQYLAAVMMLENCWANLSDAPYLNYDKDYWHDEYMDSLSINTNTRYMLAGDIALSKIGWTSCLYYNKDIYNNYLSSEYGSMEDMVLNHEWTLEDMKVMCAKVTDSTDESEDAVIGMVLNNESMCDRMTISFGIEFSKRDSEGYPYITLNNEKTEDFVNQVLPMYTSLPGFTLATEGEDLDKFIRNEALFGNGTLYTAMFRLKAEGINVNYGIIPWPLYDENMTEYNSAVQDNIALYMIPSCTAESKMGAICAVLEAMCSETYTKVTPNLYEVVLKTKYASDDIYGKIVDIINDSAKTDIIYVYSYELNRIGQFLRDIAQGKYNSFSTWWGANGEKCSNMLPDILEYLEE